MANNNSAATTMTMDRGEAEEEDDHEGEGDGDSPTFCKPGRKSRRTTVELLSTESGWLTGLTKLQQVGPTNQVPWTTAMAPIEIKTKTFDGCNTHEAGWISPLSGPQRSRSGPDKFDLDGPLATEDPDASWTKSRKRPSLTSTDVLMGMGEFTSSLEPIPIERKAQRRSTYGDDGDLLFLDGIVTNDDGGFADVSSNNNPIRRRSAPAEFDYGKWMTDAPSNHDMMNLHEKLHEKLQTTDSATAISASDYDFTTTLHQGQLQTQQQQYEIIQHQQAQEITRLTNLLHNTHGTSSASFFDGIQQQPNVDSDSTNLFVSALRSIQATLCSMGSTIKSLRADDVAIERITRAFEVTESSSQYILAGDLPMAYSNLSEAWEIIEQLQIRLGIPKTDLMSMPTSKSDDQLNTLMASGFMSMPTSKSKDQLSTLLMASNFMSSMPTSKSDHQVNTLMQLRPLSMPSFNIINVRTKNANGALVCMAEGCSKNAQGRMMATPYALCRTHHNMYLIQTGQVESWSCDCGNKVPMASDRCGNCHRWKKGMKPSERGQSFTPTYTPKSSKMSTESKSNWSLPIDALPPPRHKDPLYRLKKMMELTHLSHQRLEVRYVL
jgi:hypothetical protein